MAFQGHWKIATEPTAEPVTRDEAKDHCDIVDSENDERVDRLIRQAREYVEKRTRRQLMAATWDLMLDGSFPVVGDSVHGPRYAEIRIPRPPLRSVEYVKYVATDGTLTTLVAVTDYTVDTHEEPGRVVPAYGVSWPSTRDVLQAARIRFVAGFSDPEDSVDDQRAAVPQLFKGGILLLVEHWNTNRGPVVTGTISTEVQKTLDSILSSAMVKEAA